MRHPMKIPNTVLNNTSAASKPDELVELAPDSKSEATFGHAHGALNRIIIGQLTTCSVIEGGKRIGLDFVGQAGEPVSIEMPFDQAASIVMTIPRLLSAALKMQTRDAQARYVFSLGNWSLELAKDQHCRILSLRTPDGFEVAFAISFETSAAMGSALAGGNEARSERKAHLSSSIDCLDHNLWPSATQQPLGR